VIASLQGVAQALCLIGPKTLKPKPFTKTSSLCNVPNSMIDKNYKIVNSKWMLLLEP
jgi:hypothetical protein